MFLIICTLTVIILLFFLLWITFEGSLYPRESTRNFWKLSDMPFIKKVEGYFYAARPDLYLKPVTWKWVIKLFGGNEKGETYHGKVMTCGDAAKLIMLDKPINLKGIDHVIPYAVAKDIILDEPMPSIASMECACRAQKRDGCEPKDVCLVMGEPFVSFILEHSPHKARRLTVNEALEILKAEEKRGHIHTAWFKDAMHDRFYTICNCCTCCCLGMESYSRGTPRIAHSGYRPNLDPKQCKGCTVCERICPFNAITMQKNKPVLDFNKCMGCGLCTTHCKHGALTLELYPEKGTPLDIDELT